MSAAMITDSLIDRIEQATERRVHAEVELDRVRQARDAIQGDCERKLVEAAERDLQQLRHIEKLTTMIADERALIAKIRAERDARNAIAVEAHEAIESIATLAKWDRTGRHLRVSRKAWNRLRKASSAIFNKFDCIPF